MNISLEQGDFENLGIKRTQDGVIITFQCNRTSDAFLRLYDIDTDGSEDIPIPDEYTIGEVRSIRLSGIDFSRYEYNLVIDENEILFPYVTAVKGREKWADPARREEEKVRGAFLFPDFSGYKDRHPSHPSDSLIIYKLNVRGFTKTDNSIKSKKGTFNALTEKIPYLKGLGINAVELMPIYEFNEILPSAVSKKDLDNWNPQAKKGYEMMEHPDEIRINYWGYGPGDYHAPKAAFAQSSNPIDELIKMIASLHKANIEVYMEMCFPAGSTTNYITEILKFWVKNYHIDGFHLLIPGIDARDIASVPLLKCTRIFYDNVYSNGSKENCCKNLYQYRDNFLYTMRKQINLLDNNMIETVKAMRLQSNDIGYVNYIANNNGMTLRDLFSYSTKHNEANGERGTDGNDYNYSTNCGCEGPTRKQQIKTMRLALMRLAATVTFISQGNPLLYMGDELGNTQNGNNNPYCQDNNVGFLSWSELPKYKEYHEFIKQLIAFRKKHPILWRSEPVDFSVSGKDGYPQLSYHTKDAWTNGISPIVQTIGLLYSPDSPRAKKLYTAINFSHAMSELSVPSLPKGRQFHYVFGTSDYLNGGDADTVPATIIIPPHTVWFFEG